MKKVANNILLYMALSAPLLLGDAVVANQKPAKWEAGLRVSTFGILGEIGYLFNETFAMRIQAGGYSHYINGLECKTNNKELNEAGYTKLKHHDVHLRPQVAALYADWYFLTKWWRISAAINYNRTKMHVHTDFRDFPEPEFNLSGILTCHYRYKNKISPYLGTGFEFRNIYSSNFIISMDAGISYSGKVKVKVFATDYWGTVPYVMSKAKHDATKELNEKWWVKYFPTVSIALKYAF